jgi:predicted nucleic acid-binding protein
MGRTNYLVDTNIAIYYYGMLLAKKSEVILEEIINNQYYISVINRIELLGNKGILKQEQAALDSFINNAIIHNLNEEIILETIKIRKNYSVKLPDAIIAATCLVNNCVLVTNNTKDFEKIERLHTIRMNLIDNFG